MGASPERVPVVIIGGGCTGLTMSMMLSACGIRSVLVNDRPRMSPYPKAHIINQRTVEILDRLGLAEQVYERSTPPAEMRYAGWFAGVHGEGHDYGREIGRVEAWGNGRQDPDYIAASKCRNANIPQNRLEPLLQAKALELAQPGDVRYGHRAVSLVDYGDVVEVGVEPLDGAPYALLADYVVAADAGRFVGPLLGVEFEMVPDFSMSMASVFFSADLSAHVGAPDVVTRFLVNPDLGGAWGGGVLFPEGPDTWGGASTEWVFHTRYAGSPDAPVDRDAVLATLHRSLGIPHFAPEVHLVNAWTMDAGYARRYRVGRVFLAGDAAHRHPPTGGLGLNAGVQDAHNLAWKLAAVLRGTAGVGLLDSYEPERQPAAVRNVERAVTNATSQFLINQAIGIRVDGTPEDNWAAMERVWDASPESEPLRRRVARAIQRQRILFRHLGSELGHHYPPGRGIIDDGSEPIELVDDILVAPTSATPGYHVPHAWLQDLGAPVAIVDLVPLDGFLLIAGEHGDQWLSAAAEASERYGVRIEAIRVGLYDGDFVDVRAAWTRASGIGPDGAVLVRPDGYVAYRSPGPGDLDAALAHLLDRP